VIYDNYIKYCRQAKVNISLNGMGMWCYKDSELFAHNCFCLREHHKNLSINSLSPKDGVHHIVFKGFLELRNLIEYYLHAEKEREKINDAGHEYFKNGISGGWAENYVTGLQGYMNTGDSNEFGGLLWNNI
jgi:hypothetical protein